MTDNRTAILQRITNLRARAADEASSEAEVMAAMTRAEKLMEAYYVTEADLAIAESEGRVQIEIVHKRFDASNGATRHKVQLCWDAVTTLTNTQAVRYTHNNELQLTGDAPDVEYALYLLTLIRSGLDRAYDAYRKQTRGRLGRNAKASFQMAMANAVSRRLRAMHRENEKAHAEARKAPAGVLEDRTGYATNTALVVADAVEAKRLETEKAFKAAHPRARSGPGWGRGRSNGTAAGAGREAGSRLGLGRGVGQSSQARISA